MSRAPDLVKREGWRRRLRSFDRGTTTVEEFCWREGVSVAAFYQWRRKLADATGIVTTASRGRKTTSRRTAPHPGFVPVEITGQSPASSCIEVLLPGGSRLLVPCHEQQAIRTVIAALTDASATAPMKCAAENRVC